MINLRYHIVSITAVFLALGIGLLFGASFIDRATVEVLNDNLSAIERQNDDLEETNAALRAEVGDAEDEEQALLDEAVGQVVQGRLDGVPVLVVAVDGVDADVVARTASTLSAAGAQLGGVLWLTDRLVLDDDAEVSDLQSALQLNVDEPDRLRSSLARRLGSLLADAAQVPVLDEPEPPAEPETTVTTTPEEPGETTTTVTTEPLGPAGPTPEPEMLATLRAFGFAELDPPAVAPIDFAVVPPAGLRLVVVSGPGAVLADTDVVVPMLSEFTEQVVPQDGGPVAVAAQAGPEAERVVFVGALRNADPLRERLSTVDDIERFAGQVALVLALQHGAGGQFGHYGVGEGAESLLPPPPAPDGG